MGQIVDLAEVRARRLPVVIPEITPDQHQHGVAVEADRRMLLMIESWASCLREVVETFGQPMDPQDRKLAMNALASIRGQPVEPA